VALFAPPKSMVLAGKKIPPCLKKGEIIMKKIIFLVLVSSLFSSIAMAYPRYADLVPTSLEFCDMLVDDVSMTKVQEVMINVTNVGGLPYSHASIKVLFGSTTYDGMVYGPSDEGGVRGGPIAPGKTGVITIWLPLGTLAPCQEVVVQIDADQATQLSGGVIIIDPTTDPSLVFANDTAVFKAKDLDNPTPCIGDTCGSGKVYDCAGNCVNESLAQSWIGDGYCDEGTYGMDLVCPEFNNDGGDCIAHSCGSGKVYDCAGNCVDESLAQSWIGDGYCDEGTYGMDLVCSEFNNDGGDCVYAEAPLAFGVVSGSGSRLSGTSNWSASYNPAYKRYEITISGESYYFGDYTTVVTPSFSTGSTGYCTTDSVDGKLLIECYDSLGNPTMPSSLSFMSFKKSDGIGLAEAPLAFGVVSGSGSRVSGTSNWSASYNPAHKWYEITISGENYYFGDYTTVVTPSGGSYCTTSSVDGKLLIECYDNLVNPTMPSSLAFVSYRRP
jgi:hypothetical protein